jgi:hypothetical protein
MKNIRAIRQFLEKRKSRSIDLALGIFVGILSLPLLSWVLSLFVKLSRELLGTLLLLLCLTLLFLLAWLILLYEKYNQCKRYLSEHCPNTDLDAEDEISDVWKEQEKKDR